MPPSGKATTIQEAAALKNPYPEFSDKKPAERGWKYQQAGQDWYQRVFEAESLAKKRIEGQKIVIPL